MSDALETTQLSKRYGRLWALRDCSLALPSGRVAALVGSNGAGKTTLLHLVAGLLPPTTGQARAFGLDPQHDLKRVLPRIGFVAQDHPLYLDLAVNDLLTLGRKMNPRWDDALASTRMQSLDIPLPQRAFDPSWDVQETSLEDIVLAYLGQQSGARPAVPTPSCREEHGLERVT